MGHTVVIVWYIGTELIPTYEEASQFGEICWSRCIYYAFNLGCCWPIAIWPSQVDLGELYFGAKLDLVSCKFDVLQSGSCQYLSQDVQCFQHLFCGDQKIIYFDMDS